MTKPNVTEIKPLEKKVSKEEVESFVNANIVPLERKEVDGQEVITKSACVDGRTEPENSKGRVRMFGGDAGILLSFAATLNEKEIDIENDSIITALVNTKKEIAGPDAKLCLHTDGHGEKDGSIGCGHANRMSSSREDFNGDGKYGLTWNSAKDLFEKAWEKVEAEHVVLQGDHEELAVLLVHGGENGQRADFSVYSLDKENGKSFFVIDVEATGEYFKTIVPRMSEKLGVGLSVEDVLSNYYKQLDISAGLLAGHLEKYDVYIESAEKARVEKAS